MMAVFKPRIYGCEDVAQKFAIPKPDEPESNSLRREGATPTNSNRLWLFCGSRALATNDFDF